MAFHIKIPTDTRYLIQNSLFTFVNFSQTEIMRNVLEIRTHFYIIIIVIILK